ncbi:MAG: hypothetical protein WCP53_06690, partial [Verrucomicrobiota bacterium]
KATESANPPPGAYITKEQLANVGYATPEAALQTTFWAMIKGSYEQVIEGAGPEAADTESKNPNSGRDFETSQKVMAPLFKGLQVVAKKSLGDDKVELKVRVDADAIPGQEQAIPSLGIQRMVKIAGIWKFNGGTSVGIDTWESEGQIESYSP